MIDVKWSNFGCRSSCSCGDDPRNCIFISRALRDILTITTTYRKSKLTALYRRTLKPETWVKTQTIKITTAADDKDDKVIWKRWFHIRSSFWKETDIYVLGVPIRLYFDMVAMQSGSSVCREPTFLIMVHSHVLTRPCSQVPIPNHYVLLLLCSSVPFLNHYVLNSWGDGCSPINEVTHVF